MVMMMVVVLMVSLMRTMEEMMMMKRIMAPMPAMLAKKCLDLVQASLEADCRGVHQVAACRKYEEEELVIVIVIVIVIAIKYSAARN